MSETQGDREAMWLGRLKDADARGDRNWKLAMDEQARRLAAEKERDEALTMAADLEGYRQHAEAAGLCEAQMEAEHARAEAAEKREARLRERLEAQAREWEHIAEDVWDDEPHTAQDYANHAAALQAALLDASAASEAQPPPASSMPVASSTQEGEKAPEDSRDPPPETA